MAVRVTSEDANDGFKPTCGTIDEISFRPSPDVWGYFSVKSGGGIHEYSDSQVPSEDDASHKRESSTLAAGCPLGLSTCLRVPHSSSARQANWHSWNL